MHTGISICLSGANVAETARALEARLVELGRSVEHADAWLIEQMKGPRAAGHACGVHAQNGAMVIVVEPAIVPEGESLTIEVSANDLPEFAAEKILDVLAERGLIALDDAGFSPEEEEQVRQRLSDLGYIE